MNLLSECLGLREEVQERAEKMDAVIAKIKQGLEEVAEKVQEHHLSLPRKIAMTDARVDALVEEVSKISRA